MDDPVDLPQPHLGEPGVAANVRAVVAVVVGVATGFAWSFVLSWSYSVLLGWMMSAAVFVAWMWITIWPMNAPTTAKHAVREDPGRAAADVVVLMASVASLAAVAVLLLETGEKAAQAALAIGSVALAWASVHTVFTTRYARIYYSGPDEGVDFNEADPPCYSDFAYLAFTIGMTFQVSDTDLKTKKIRATALKHALLSYLFGAVIIAAMINLVVSLGNH
jgi:uncharacterized membrane protein